MKWQQLLLGIIIGVGITWLYVNHSNFSSLEESANEDRIFIFGNNLNCTILYATHNEDVDQNISLIALNTDKPRVLHSNGVDSPTEKLYDNPETIALQLIASGSGSVDTILLNKKNGVFVRTTVGNFLGMYAIAEKGICK